MISSNHLTSWQKLQSFLSLSFHCLLCLILMSSSFGHQRPQSHQLAAHTELFTEHTAVSGGIHGNMEVVEIFHRGLSQAICPSSRPLLLHTGRLSNLQAAHHTKRSENNTCEIQLTCSVENPNDNVSFRWQVAGIPYHSETNLSYPGTPRASEETYTCIAENPGRFLSSSASGQECL